MKIKIAKYIAEFLEEKGIEDVFTVTGGGAMHLNDALGHARGLHCTYNHHEQACAIAAEGYTRLTGKLAAVCVTSGPGGTNAITGVLGGWLDSIPMFILSGQVKRETTLWATDIPLRQLGDQEYCIVDSVKPMTKYAVMITDPWEIRYHLEKAYYLATVGRGGPVWLDIPLDIQAAMVETEELCGFDPAAEKLDQKELPVYDTALSSEILEKIRNAKRPLIFAGTGIRLGNARKEFLALADKLQIPVVTAWNAHDVLPTDSPCFCGKPGTVGTRAGNFLVMSCDLLLVLGSRLNIRLVSYNYKDFAKDAYKIIVDIDENELHKPTVHPDLAVHADVKDVMADLLKHPYDAENETHKKWLNWAVQLNRRYPAVLDRYRNTDSPMNPYAFLDVFFQEASEDEVMVCGNGSACVMTFQACRIKEGQRLFTNSGCAAMGYGFPAAIGAAIARKGKQVVCIDGDGSFQMNLQELQTVVYNRLNMKIIYLNNDGYHSIRQTQNNLFKGEPLVGVCDGNGLSFPDMEKIAYAYGIPYVRIDHLGAASEQLKEALHQDGPVMVEAVLDPGQNFEPKLSSKVLPDGKIVSPALDDMFPFLDPGEYEEIHRSCKELS